jgi:hypothetical protein
LLIRASSCASRPCSACRHRGAIATKWLRERPYREKAAVKRQAGADVGRLTPQTPDA